MRLANLRTGATVREFKGHAIPPWRIALSPDGKRLISGEDRSGRETAEVRVWEVEIGQCLQKFAAHVPSVGGVALNTDGRLALTCGRDNLVKVWDVVTGQCVPSMTGHSGDGVDFVCMSVDGRQALSKGRYGSNLRVWNLSTGQSRRTFTDLMQASALTPDGRHLVCLDKERKNIQMWRADFDAPLYVAPFALARAMKSEVVQTSERAYHQAVGQAQSELAAGNWTESARHARQARALPGYQQGAEALDVWFALYARLPRKALDGACLATTLTGFPDDVMTVCISGDGRYIVTGCGYGEYGNELGDVRLWETASGKMPTRLAQEKSLHAVFIDAGGKQALAGVSNSIRCWSVPDAKDVGTFAGQKTFPSGQVTAVRLSADGRLMLSSSLYQGQGTRVAAFWNRWQARVQSLPPSPLA